MSSQSIPPPPFYRFRPHPWHGLDAGDRAPSVVNAYIEITPFDTMKYEIDKSTGYLRVDRPQRGSATPPTLYGFIPRTYCAHRVAALSAAGTDRADGDPLDIVVLSERPITRNEIVLDARVVGGICIVDRGEADDKIVGVLDNDEYYNEAHDIAALPKSIIDRLVHYFATYKLMPGTENHISVAGIYGRDHALEVVNASMADYQESYDLAPSTLKFS
ncbi:MAG TPA: inorganic pyrophosphatase [Polyangiaceae bacterium]|nr:inorganic pyrophosphatase [Polyangiaceae bacterium]